MAYKTANIEKEALEVIKKHKLVFMHEVSTFLKCSKATIYNHKIEQLDTIKEALEANKINLKMGLRKKWYDSDNASVQIALYKLIGTDQESDRINSQKTNIGGGIEIIVKRPDVVK